MTERPIFRRRRRRLLVPLLRLVVGLSVVSLLLGGALVLLWPLYAPALISHALTQPLLPAGWQLSCQTIRAGYRQTSCEHMRLRAPYDWSLLDGTLIIEHDPRMLWPHLAADPLQALNIRLQGGALVAASGHGAAAVRQIGDDTVFAGVDGWLQQIEEARQSVLPRPADLPIGHIKIADLQIKTQDGFLGRLSANLRAADGGSFDLQRAGTAGEGAVVAHGKWLADASVTAELAMDAPWSLSLSQGFHARIGTLHGQLTIPGGRVAAATAGLSAMLDQLPAGLDRLHGELILDMAQPDLRLSVREDKAYASSLSLRLWPSLSAPAEAGKLTLEAQGDLKAQLLSPWLPLAMRDADKPLRGSLGVNLDGYVLTREPASSGPPAFPTPGHPEAAFPALIFNEITLKPDIGSGLKGLRYLGGRVRAQGGINANGVDFRVDPSSRLDFSPTVLSNDRPDGVQVAVAAAPFTLWTFPGLNAVLLEGDLAISVPALPGSPRLPVHVKAADNGRLTLTVPNAEWRVKPDWFTGKKPALPVWLRDWVQRADGVMSFDITYDRRHVDSDLSGKINTDLDALTLFGVPLQGVRLSDQLSVTWPTGTVASIGADKGGSLTIDHARLGEALAIDSLVANWVFRGDDMVLKPISAEALGGEIRMDGFVLPLDGRDFATELHVSGLDLSRLAVALAVPGLRLSGQMNGRMRLLREAGVYRVADGMFTAEAGTLSYQGALASGAAPAGAGLAFDIMKDFRYDRMVLSLSGVIGADQLATLRLVGRNPAVYDGYPVDMNINLTGALDTILQRSVETLNIPDRLQQQLLSSRDHE